MEKPKIIDVFNITGRGKVLVTDALYDTHKNVFNKKEIVLYKEKIYKIIGVEALLKKEKNQFIDYLALLCTEL